MDDTLTPIFCRTGSKYHMRDQIIRLMPAHSVYVEPFVGSGAIYWGKPHVTVSVINDIDKQLMSDYRKVKTATLNIDKYPAVESTIPAQTKFLKKTAKNKEEKLFEAVIRNCNGFAGVYIPETTNRVYRPADPMRKIKNISQYKAHMKNTKIHNIDYKAIIKKYDSTNTLFYLDPPYEGSNVYKNNQIDYDELSSILQRIKGKFVLSLASTPNILRVFKMFKKKTLKLKSNANSISPIGNLKRTELIFRNF